MVYVIKFMDIHLVCSFSVILFIRGERKDILTLDTSWIDDIPMCGKDQLSVPHAINNVSIKISKYTTLDLSRYSSELLFIGDYHFLELTGGIKPGPYDPLLLGGNVMMERHYLHLPKLMGIPGWTIQIHVHPLMNHKDPCKI